MNVRDAAYYLVRDYPGGAVALAPRLGKKANTLSQEVRPPEGSAAKFGLLDAVTAMAFSGDHRVLYAIAAELGYVAVPMPDLADEHGEGAERLAAVAREFADVLTAAAGALADGTVTDNELRSVERQWSELVAEGQRLLQQFVALNEAGKRRGR